MSQRESRHDVVEQQPQVGVHRVVAGELRVEVLREDLHVAGLVHHLRGGVVLGVDPGDGLDDFRRAQERALLAVHELGEQPVLVLHAELQEALLVPLLEDGAGDRRLVPLHLRRVCLGVGDDDALLVDLNRPVQVGLPVPLGLLGLLVEPVELGLGALLVVPRELGGAVVGHTVEAFDVVFAHEVENRFEVVDLFPTDQVQVGPEQVLVGGVLVECGHCAAPLVAVVELGVCLVVEVRDGDEAPASRRRARMPGRTKVRTSARVSSGSARSACGEGSEQ